MATACGSWASTASSRSAGRAAATMHRALTVSVTRRVTAAEQDDVSPPVGARRARAGRRSAEAMTIRPAGSPAMVSTLTHVLAGQLVRCRGQRLHGKPVPTDRRVVHDVQRTQRPPRAAYQSLRRAARRAPPRCRRGRRPIDSRATWLVHERDGHRYRARRALQRSQCRPPLDATTSQRLGVARRPRRTARGGAHALRLVERARPVIASMASCRGDVDLLDRRAAVDEEILMHEARWRRSCRSWRAPTRAAQTSTAGEGRQRRRDMVTPGLIKCVP